MMKTITLLLSLVAIALVSTTAFVPQLPAKHTFGRVVSTTKVNGFMGGDEDRQVLTRENEPDEFFAT